MKAQLIALCAILIALALSRVAAAEPSDVEVVVIGDSTVAEWALTGEKRGWGQKLGLFFGPGVVVLNEAENGRSSKSFIERYDEDTQITYRLWDDALALMPDYVLIQFGHNDLPGKPHETIPDPVPDPLLPSGLGSDQLDWYRNNIRTYVNESLAIGAYPIIVTPMERRIFDPQTPGMIKRINEPYADAAKEIAIELGVPVVDLHHFSIELYETLYQQVGNTTAGEYLHSTSDATHFSEAGARVYAKEVANALDTTPLGTFVVPFVPLASGAERALLALGLLLGGLWQQGWRPNPWIRTGSR